MRTRFLAITFSLVLALSWTTAAQAELVVDILDATMLSSSRTSVDVLVSSNAGALDITSFELTFGISEQTTGGILQFQGDFDSTDAFRQSDSERTDGNYVLLNNVDLDFFRSRRGATNQRLIQADRTASAATPATIGAGQSLLARLEIEHIAPLPVDGEFEIFLVEGANTLFLNGFVPVDIDASSFATRASNMANGTSFDNFGIVTVNAIPEPSSLAVLGLVAAACGLSQRRRR